MNDENMRRTRVDILTEEADRLDREMKVIEARLAELQAEKIELEAAMERKRHS